MSNYIESRKNSKTYIEAAKLQKISARNNTQNPIRNAKISAKLKGRKYTEERRNKLIGHIVTQETREKLRLANRGKKWTDEQKLKFSKSQKGKFVKPHTKKTKRNISITKLKFTLLTPFGEFETFQDICDIYDINIDTIKHIFISLKNIPQNKILKIFNLENPNKLNYEELGFKKKLKI